MIEYKPDLNPKWTVMFNLVLTDYKTDYHININPCNIFVQTWTPTTTILESATAITNTQVPELPLPAGVPEPPLTTRVSEPPLPAGVPPVKQMKN